MAFKTAMLRTVARAKRVIFMTTLYLQMIRNTNPSKDCLEDLNRLFKLVGDVNALRLPSLLRQKIWGNKDAAIRRADEKLAEGNLDEACQTVLSNTPRWLRYDKKTPEGLDQQNDVKDVALKVAQDRYFCSIRKH